MVCLCSLRAQENRCFTNATSRNNVLHSIKAIHHESQIQALGIYLGGLYAEGYLCWQTGGPILTILWQKLPERYSINFTLQYHSKQNLIEISKRNSNLLLKLIFISFTCQLVLVLCSLDKTKFVLMLLISINKHSYSTSKL